ncbi:RCC1-like domain-containing protein, partial [Bacillus cereus]
MDYISPKEEVLKVKRWPKDTIAAGRGHTVGLKSDGTAVAVGRNKEGECNVSGWRDI